MTTLTPAACHNDNPFRDEDFRITRESMSLFLTKVAR